MDGNSIFRKLPKMDILIARANDVAMARGGSITVTADNCRCVIDDIRNAVTDGRIDSIPELDDIAIRAYELEVLDGKYSLRKVINASGVVIHTNLGRAVMPKKVAEHIQEIASSYSTLEYDLNSGERGSRHSHIEPLLCKITGAEAAMAVNNNAAAIMLALSSVCQGKEVVVSRGELVEIGGSFRVPEIMALSGTQLKEVGTTNKTKPSDYSKAIADNTAALLKVHTSNFKIVGFSQSVNIADLAVIASENDIPLIYDLGSGLMTTCEGMASIGENTVLSALQDGADIVCFSGDKLFGGSQAGIIVGKRKYIEMMKKHQLARALRIDKLSLAALEATLRIYLDPKQALAQIPVLRDINAPLAELEQRAKKLRARLAKIGGDLDIRVVKSDAQVGGGSAPGENLPSFVVEIISKTHSANDIEQTLRGYETPIISRIHKGSVLLDVRTIADNEFEPIQKALKKLAQINDKTSESRANNNKASENKASNDKTSGSRASEGRA